MIDVLNVARSLAIKAGLVSTFSQGWETGLEDRVAKVDYYSLDLSPDEKIRLVSTNIAIGLFGCGAGK